MYDAGYAGMTWPEEYGGRGAPYSHQAIVLEEFARAGAHVVALGPGEALAGRLRAVRSHLGAGDLPLVDVARVMTGGRLACPIFGEGRLFLGADLGRPWAAGVEMTA